MIGMSAELEPLLVHAAAGDLDAIQAIPPEELPKRLRKRDEDGRGALHRACAAGHAEVAKFLVAASADVDVADNEGWTALHSCASKGEDTLVGLLLDGNADVNAATSSSATSLHSAASKGHSAVVALLLTAGAKRNVKDRQGGTALARAVGTGREKVVKQLLDASADPSLRDQAGDNALHVAINAQQVAVCGLLMARDEAEKLMLQENGDGKTPAQMILEMEPFEARETMKSVWRSTQSGG
mmetsp:Transcript_20677/g.52800  ORF Transcript_20677/g.52800 Transcript_20677/m.52800 type:complete len:241 (-) Transcript_20677:99-821(-)